MKLLEKLVKEEKKYKNGYFYEGVKKYNHNTRIFVRNYKKDSSSDNQVLEIWLVKRKGILGDYYYDKRLLKFDDYAFDPNGDVELGKSYVEKILDCVSDKNLSIDKSKLKKYKNEFEQEKNSKEDSRPVYNGDVPMFG